MTEHRRRTRILATLGPATDAPGVLDALIAAGVDCVRLNFSHGDPSAQVKRAHDLREAVYLADTVYVMSRRPGKIVKISKIELPRPRKMDDPDIAVRAALLHDQLDQQGELERRSVAA